MKQIDILTSNNVTVQYELASVGQRFVSLMLDTIFQLIYYYVMFLILGAIFLFGGSDIFLYILVFPVYFFYNLFCEVFFNGQTLGKKIMKIRVLKVDGNPPSIGDSFIRWTYRVVDIYASLGAIAAIFVSSSEKSQRLGDIAANTAVIKLQPDVNYALKDILKLSNTNDYTPTYTQVVSLSDEDMLLIKNTLDRFRSNPNDANKKMVLSLVQKSKELLEIENIPKNKIEFLGTLLKDYVILTR